MAGILFTLHCFLVSLFIIAILKRLSLKLNLLKPKGIPLIGGIGMGASFLILSSFFQPAPSEQIKGIIIASTAMLIFGVIDDWKELSVWAKFLVEIIATSFLIVFGIRTQIAFLSNILNIVVTTVWVLAITNAFNHLDVMDGVASGVALIVGLAFLCISGFNNDQRIIPLCLILIGSTSAFLAYNWPPAKIYMGNSGSHFLGFLLAAMALSISYAPQGKKIALLSPLFILGLPIFDTLFLIITRVLKNNAPFNKSNDHLSLRYEKLGYSRKRVLCTMLILALFYSLCGVALSQVRFPWDIITVFTAGLFSLLLALRMGKIVIHD